MSLAASRASRATEPIILAARPGDHRVELDIHIPGSLLYFQGHFLRYPILPGVVQVGWAIAYGRRYLAVSTAPAAVIQVKFSKPIRPEERLCLVLSYAAEQHRLSFACSDGDGTRSSGRVTFAEP